LGASIPADGTLALWNTERSQQIGQIHMDVQPESATLAFDAHGTRLAVALSGGVAYVLNVDPAWWRMQACDLAARRLTESEKAIYLGSMDMPDECPRN
jgi:hypothetical protein